MNKESKFDKFVFETDFFEVAVNEQKNVETRILTEEDVVQAQSRGYAEGLEKGQQQAMEQLNAEMVSHLTPLKEKLEQFASEKNALRKIMEKRSIAVVSQVVSLLFKHLEKELGEETLATAISQTLDNITKDVHISVKVNQKSYDFLCKHEGVQSLLANKDARLSVNEDLAHGECSLAWDEAGADIDLVALTQEIQATLYGLLPEHITMSEVPVEETKTEAVEKTEEEVASLAEEQIEVVEDVPTEEVTDAPEKS